MTGLSAGSIGIAAAKMIRRNFGLADNTDLEWIEALGHRAACERRNLRLNRGMMVEGDSFGSIQEVTRAARTA